MFLISYECKIRIEGTGASIGNNMIVAGSRSNEKVMFVDTLEGVHPSVEMSIVPDLMTSSQVSDYILDGLQENRREFNFGSFVFGDVIDANININWSEMNNDSDNLLTLVDNLIFSQLDSSDIIDALNQTVTFLNIPDSEIYIALISQVINNGGTLPDIVNKTVSFFGIDANVIEQALLDGLFNGVDDVSFGGQNWTLNLTQESVESIFDGGNATYPLSVDVPVSLLHNTSSSHR